MAKSRKTTYGNGGIYADSQRPGHYIVQVPTGHGKYTRRRSVDRQSAEALYKELLNRRADDIKISASAKTLQWLVDEWKARVIDGRQESSNPLAPKTMADYHATITRYLLPDWGTHRLEEFNVLLILEIFHTLRKKYSEYIAHKALTKLYMLLQAAYEWDFIRKNPIPEARKRIAPYKTPEKEALTPEETIRLFEIITGHRLEVLYHVALILGLRPGELLGLQWIDIDWDKRTLEVRRQVQEINGKVSIKPSTKYGEGKRKVPIPPRLFARLRILWEAGPTSIFIFPNDDGVKHIAPRSFNRHFAGGAAGRKDKNGKPVRLIGIRQKAGLSNKITPHCMRHTVSTRLMEQGTPDQIRDAIMGHGKDGVRELYGHARLEVMRRALEQLERELFEGDDRLTGVV